MTDTSYTIHTKSNGSIIADFQSGDLHNLTRGESSNFTFNLPQNTDLVVENGETYTVPSGQTIGFETTTVNTGGTLIVNGTLQTTTFVDNTTNGTTVNGQIIVTDTGSYTTLQEYEHHAGSYSLNETLQNAFPYSEQLPPSQDSIVFRIEPSTDLQTKNVRPIWGIVDSITDNRNTALNNISYQISVTVLAFGSEYSDFTSIENDLKIEL